MAVRGIPKGKDGAFAHFMLRGTDVPQKISSNMRRVIQMKAVQGSADPKRNSRKWFQ